MSIKKNVTIDDLISYDDVLTLMVHRSFSETAGKPEEMLEWYKKNKHLFFPSQFNNLYITKNILDFLPNKKNDN